MFPNVISVTRAIAPRAAVFSHAALNVTQASANASIPAPTGTINGMQQVQQFSTSQAAADQFTFPDQQFFSFQPQQQPQQPSFFTSPRPVYNGLVLSPPSHAMHGMVAPVSPGLQHVHGFHSSAPYYLKSDEPAAPASGNGKRTVRRRKKDKNAPKRALTAYMIFSMETRTIVVSENPSLSFTEVGRILGERWRALTPEQKKPFEEKANLDKERYALEREEYYKTKKAELE